MSLLNINKLSKNFGYGELFKNVSFDLDKGEILSIVGPNGCGKTTLLKIISGEESCDKGNVSLKKDAKLSYLKQVCDESSDKICYEYLRDAFIELNKIEMLIKKYELLINNTSDSSYDKNLKKYCELIDKFNDLGGYEIDIRISEVCSGLGITNDMLNQKLSSLSGGERTLIQLAKCLIQKPDIFLLDEPTNHLDIEKMEWLENYLKSFRGAIVIVSHDRYFLDKMSTKILDLSDNDPKVYNMNYSLFLETKEKEFEKQMSDFKLQQQQIKKLEQEVSYFIQKANQTKSSAMYDRAKQLRNKIQKIRDYGVKKPKISRKININFSEENNISKTAFNVENLSVIKPNGDKILDDLNMNIKFGERIAIIGSNGSGKSTFINTLLNNQKLEHFGRIDIGPSTKIGYLPQVIEFENPQLTVLEFFQIEACKDIETSRRILSTYHFYQDNINKKIGKLSEGEKIRLMISIIMQKSVNCIIFDEPTNHIDIETKEVLEDAIETFSGTFLFVSHDRYFINKFADKIYEFKDGKVSTYYGNYDYYKEKKNEINVKIK